MVKAIVVDDEEDSADSIAQSLEIGGIDVLAKGHDGEQAFQLYKKLKPDVILLDMKMPNFDGGYAIEKIKVEDPNAKIIVVTAFTDYDFDKNEVSAIFYKPYEFEELLDAIKELTA